MDRQQALREIPSVDRLLHESAVRESLAAGQLPRSVVLASIREILEQVRRSILDGEAADLDPSHLAHRGLERARAKVAPRLVRVVNATGVVLHTNLGRAPLAAEAREAMDRVAGYCNLEYDLARGHRGYRHDSVSGLICEMTGAEAGLVVNNNAAAVLLGLAALARDREVVVSRGELVEIGGSFRVPDVMAESGCVLREVGTTNKTHVSDYQRAMGADTALLLKVHRSNYRILGFTSEVSLAELVSLGRRGGVPVMKDLGSGCLVDLTRLGLDPEPTVQDAVAAGADLVTFSTDKLLGGPQAGILVGRRTVVEACAGHPLMRALRPDKVTLAALEATLALYRDPMRAVSRVPALAMLVADASVLRARAGALADQLRGVLQAPARVEIREDVSEVGGGSLPLQRLPTWVVEIRYAKEGTSRTEVALRKHSPPVIARIRDDALVFDPRTLRQGEDRIVVDAVAWAASEDR